MPKNTKTNNKGGKKHKRFKKQKNTTDSIISVHFMKKEEDMEYGVITKVLGDKRFLCVLKSFDKKFNEKQLLVRVPKKFRRKRWFVNVGDYVLVGIREYQQERGDIIYLYDNKEVRKLIKEGELSRTHVDGEVEKVDAFVLDDYDMEELEDLKNQSKIPPQPKKDFDLLELDAYSSDSPTKKTEDSFDFDDL